MGVGVGVALGVGVGEGVGLGVAAALQHTLGEREGEAPREEGSPLTTIVTSAPTFYNELLA